MVSTKAFSNKYMKNDHEVKNRDPKGGGPAFGTKRGTKWGIKELICWLRKLIILSTFGPFL